MLETGKKLKIWKIIDRGTSASVQCSNSVKDKETGKYTTEWSDYMLFIGQAYQAVKKLKEGDMITAGHFGVRNVYDKEKGVKIVSYIMRTINDQNGASPDTGSYTAPPKADPAPAVEEPDTEEDPF